MQHKRLPGFLFWLLATVVPAASRAEGPGNIELQQYQAPPFYYRYLRVDAPEVLPAWKVHFALDGNYALKPLVVDDLSPSIQTERKTAYDVVRHAVAADLAASVGLFGRFELGGSLPITVYQVGEAAPGTKGAGLLGIGNPKLGLKARILGGHAGGFGLGASVLVSLPTGIGGALIRETTLGGEARLFGGYHTERWSVAGSGGFKKRGADVLFDIPIGNEVTFGAAADLKLLAHTRALVELAGSTAAGNLFHDAKETPIEALLGLRQHIGHLELTLAGGPGLQAGYGSPVARGVLSIAWSDAPHDADGDGIPDDKDRCPSEPEDKDGFEDSDGCPDPDNDKDGILDAKDKCPNEAEDKDGFEDSDGCPDLDNDKDKIPDASDKCPDKPETYNEFEDADGCPDEVPPKTDKDKDGITDDADECPDEPEDKDGFEDEDGCPDLDNDKDGIPDAKDKCPNDPETINGKDDEDGCPDKGPEAAVKIGQAELETLRPVYFDTDRARVRHAFYNILGQVAATLKAHPEIGRCAVEGHTDDAGPAEWNQKLSQLRAQAVVDFLVKKGVERERLNAIGHGEKVPWTSNETEGGRAKNRRVIFHIEGVNLDDQLKQELRKKIRYNNAAAKARAAERAEQEASPDEPTPARKSREHEKEPAEKAAHEKSEKPAHEKSADKPAHEKSGDKPSHEKSEKPAREGPAEKPGASGKPAPGKIDEKGARERSARESAGESRTTASSRSGDDEDSAGGSKPLAPAAKGAKKARAKDAENPTTLRELLKLPSDAVEPEGPVEGPRNLPKRRASAQ